MQTLLDISLHFQPLFLRYTSKEIIYTPDKFEKNIGFVISGECIVERLNHDKKTIPLNKLNVNDSFGVIAIFGNNDVFPTQVRALTDTEIIFFTQSQILLLIDNYPIIAKNIIKYLSEKIVFLNSKIATFSADTVEQKLANYILNESDRIKCDCISFNCKKSAEAINSGRASLYRAISSLTDAKFIKLENKKIYIIDRTGLERNLK